MAIIFEEHDRELARIYLRDLERELDAMERVIDIRKMRVQLLQTLRLINNGDAYGARMSLYHIQNETARISAKLGNSTGNIKILRAVLRAWHCLSEAGRPLGHTLDRDGATPFKAGGIR
jgi:hypothetical protein